MGQNSASESEDGAYSANSPLSCNEGDSIGGKSSDNGMILKKGPWTSAEDAVLMDYVKKNGEGNWNAVQKHTGLARCGKSCRLRWANHLRPNLKKGAFTLEEEKIIIELHAKMGNKWARMAAHLPGRTDNEIKNYWNTRIKRHQRAGLPIYPPNLYLPAQSKSHQPLSSPSNCSGDFACHDDTLLQFNGHTKSDAMSGLFSIFQQKPEYGISPRHSCDDVFLSPHGYTIAQGPDKPILGHESSDASEPPLFGTTYGAINCHSQSFSMKFSGDLSFDRDTHCVSSIFPSASKHPIDAQKLELPSLQYQETNLGFWDPKSKPSDAVTHSPVSGGLSWNCPYSGSSGLLEDLIYGAKALSKPESHSACWATSCDVSAGDATGDSALNACVTGKVNFNPISTLDNAGGSVPNGRTPTSTMGSSLEDIIVHHLKSETADERWTLVDEMKNGTHSLDYSRPDTLLESCGNLQNSLLPPENCPIGSSEASLGDDSKNRSSTSGLGSCPWNNMPAACQISEIP